MIGRFRTGETGADDGATARIGDVMRGERERLGKSLLDMQRELKIKATYIAAIENANPDPFETPGFVAGYVRSYARYLQVDPDWAWRAFCAESGFGSPDRAARRLQDASRRKPAATPFGSQPIGISPARDGLLARIQPGAIGSLLVLAGLIGVLGYGGYAVLSEVQKVRLVPVEEAPEVVAEFDPLESARPVPPEDGNAAVAVTASGFDRLYRPDPLDVPVIVARDGPIATLDPGEIGALAGLKEPGFTSAIELIPGLGALPGAERRVPTATERAVLAALGQAPDALPAAAPEDPRPQVLADVAPEVVVFAVRPSWVRIQSAEGTTLYEAIMQEGDRFVLPRTEEPATLRTGESGAIYFSVDGTPYGPAGRPGAITGNLPLAAASLRETYEVADPQSDTALSRVVVELQADPPRRPGEIAEE